MAWLAIRDYTHEWRMSACFVLALAATLAPMLVLFGLKFGIVSSMAEQLVQDPRNREIRPVGSSHYEAQWFESFSQRSDVAFISPRTRAIAATINFQNPQVRPLQIVKAELLPTAEGEPLLSANTQIPQGMDEIILSRSAAHKLKVLAGDEIDGSIARILGGKKERVHLPLKVLAVANPGAFARDGAFVSLALLIALEDYRDGRAVPNLGWSGNSATLNDRSYPRFRLYARSIDDVAILRNELETQGIEVRTRSADIEIVQSLDRNLSNIFWIIAIVALSGFSLSLGSSLWANVDRKRRELSVMRLVGFRTNSIILFPVMQAIITSVLGWLLASMIYLGVEQGLNQMFPTSLNMGNTICQLLPIHYQWAALFTLVSCIIASALGGFQASRIEPSEGVREV
ncbi:MAG: ABC transporter permease [Pseudomonadota bacterium]